LKTIKQCQPVNTYNAVLAKLNICHLEIKEPLMETKFICYANYLFGVWHCTCDESTNLQINLHGN
jgi:hypothetical protein